MTRTSLRKVIMKTDPEKPLKSLQGEGPPDDTIGTSNAVFAIVVPSLIVIALAGVIVWWLVR
jgi:hypothetical protein